MDYLRKPWEHQLEAIRRQRLLPQSNPQEASYALFFDVGAGKSKTAIEIWRERCNSEKRFLRTLVLCPPIVVPKWKKEFLENSKVPPERIILLDGEGKRRFKRMKQEGFNADEAVRIDPDLPSRQSKIFVTNYETLLMGDVYALFFLYQFEAVIFDESHEIKNYKTKRSQKAERLANAGPVIPFKQILSGSPMLNKEAEDLFHQFLVLDGGRTFGSNFFVFQARYFRDRNAGMPRGPGSKYFPKWELMTLQKDGFDAESAISAAMANKMMAVKKQDCLDLPPLVEETIAVPMSSLQARLYKEMARDFVTYMGDDVCVATLAMTKALRLQQIASGYIKTTEDEEIELDFTPKMQELERLLTAICPHSKVLVWAAWRNNYAQIRRVFEKLGVKYVEIHGDISASKKQAAMHALNNDPEVRGLIGHPGAGGVGIDLIQASYSITYSRTFSKKHKIQKDGRNYRGGSEIHERITQYDLVCEGTIDEIICEKLAKGIEMSDKLLSGLATQLKEQGI